MKRALVIWQQMDSLTREDPRGGLYDQISLSTEMHTHTHQLGSRSVNGDLEWLTYTTKLGTHELVEETVNGEGYRAEANLWWTTNSLQLRLKMDPHDSSRRN